MSDSLARLQASGVDTLAQRTVEVCLAQGVVKKVQQLASEREALEIEIERSKDREGEIVPKMGDGAEAIQRRDEIVAELEQLYDTMREHTGRITVAAVVSAGEWRQWVDQHPARETGTDSNGWPILSPYDLAVAGGFCNASALIERVGDFVTEWDGEPLGPGQWDWLKAKIAPGDLKSLATNVVRLYEEEGSRPLPKSSAGSSTTASSADS